MIKTETETTLRDASSKLGMGQAIKIMHKRRSFGTYLHSVPHQLRVHVPWSGVRQRMCTLTGMAEAGDTPVSFLGYAAHMLRGSMSLVASCSIKGTLVHGHFRHIPFDLEFVSTRLAIESSGLMLGIIFLEAVCRKRKDSRSSIFTPSVASQDAYMFLRLQHVTQSFSLPLIPLQYRV